MAENLPLDPWPWRTPIGTRGGWREKYAHMITFAPREGFEQDRSKYPDSEEKPMDEGTAYDRTSATRRQT